MRLAAIDRNVMTAQAKNCLFALHVGTTILYVLPGCGRAYGARLEVLTPFQRWRYSRGEK